MSVIYWSHDIQFTTLSLTTFNLTALSITTFSIVTLSIMGSFAKLSVSNIQYK